MSSSATGDLQLFTEQAQTISDEHQHVLIIINRSINAHIQKTIQNISYEVTSQTKDNKEQVKQIMDDLGKSLKNKFSTSLLTIFSSLHENLRDNDLSAFSFDTWMTNNMNILEENFGSQCIPPHKVLNIINDLSTTWTEKIEKLQAAGKASQMGSPFSEISRPMINSGEENKNPSPGKDYDEISETKSTRSGTGKFDMKTEGRAKSETGHTIGSKDTESKGTFLSRMKGIFKTNSSQEGITATKVNLGNEKNFKYDPIKKRYVFEGEEDVSEEEDHGPPPMMTKTEPLDKEEKENEDAEKAKEKIKSEPKKTESNNMMIPPTHRALSRKKEKGKGAAGSTEPKKPAFMPSMFVPATKNKEEKVKEGDGDSVGKGLLSEHEEYNFGKSHTEEEIIKKLEEIFENHELFQKSILDSTKFKTVLESVENIVRKEMKQKLEKEMEVILLQNELESNAESMNKEVSQKQAYELEISLLRDRTIKLALNEQELSIKLEEMEKELEMYREACNSKSEILSLVNESDYQEKITEAHFKSLQDANEQKKKVLEARNELRELEMHICEKEMEAKVWEERYNEILRQNEEERKLPTKLRLMIEEYLRTQNEQDEVIIKLKEENCEILKQYRRAFEEIGRIAEENFKIGEEVKIRKEDVARLQRRIQEKELDLQSKDERIARIENESQQRNNKINQLEKQIEQLYINRRGLEELRETEKEEFASMIEDLKRKIEEIKKAKDWLQREKEEVIRERDILYQEKEEVIHEKELVLTEKDKLENEKYDLERQIDKLLQVQKKLENEKEKVIFEKDEVIVEKENLSREKESLEKFREELTRSNLVLEGKLQEMDRETKGYKSERQQWSQSLFEFVKGLEKGETENNSTNEFKMFKGVREYMEETIQNCKEEEIALRLMGVMSKVKECMENQIDEIKRKKELERCNLQAKLESLEKEKHLVEGEKDLLKEEIERLRNTVTEERAKSEELKGQVDRLEESEENARSEKEDLALRLKEFEQEFGAQRDKYEENLKNLSELKAREENLLQQLESRAQLDQQFQNKEEEIRELRRSLESQIKKLNEENIDLQQQLDEGFTQYSYLQGKAKESLEQINTLTAENQIITQELEQLKIEISIKEEIESQNRILKDEIESLNHRLNILSEELQSKDNEILDLRANSESNIANVSSDEKKEIESPQLTRKLREEKEESLRKQNQLEETVAILEEKIQSLEEEKRHLRAELRSKLEESTREMTISSENPGEGADGDKLCSSIERIYGESVIFGYLTEFIETMKTEKDVTPFKVCLDLVGSLEDVFERFKNEKEELQMRIESLTRVIENGHFINKENVGATVVQPQAETSEELEQIRKELEERNSEIRELNKEVNRLKDELGAEDPKEQAGIKKVEPTVKDLKKEIKKEQDKYKKLNNEAEAYKKMIKNIDEERGAIQKSYTQIIRNLSQEIDELKRKKGIPIAPMTTKSIQTEEEEVGIKQVEEASPEKKVGFLSGLSKFI